MWKLQLHCHVQPRAALELAHSHTRSPTRWLVLSRTRKKLAHSLALRSNLLTFFQTLSNLLARCRKTIQFSLASFMLFLK